MTSVRARMASGVGPPIEVVRTSTDWLLLLRPGLVMSPEVVLRLDLLLRPFEASERRTHLYSYAEAANVLGVSHTWLRRRVTSGELPYHRVGSSVKFTGADLDTILDGMARGHDPEGA